MKRQKIIALCGVAAVLCAAVFFIPCIKVLSIHARLNPGQMYVVKADILKGFDISYTHSVNKGRVFDHYVIMDDDTLLLEKTTFVSYGAGIPEPEETPGAVFTVTDEGYVISNLQRNVPKLVMAVGIIANHGLSFIYDEGECYFTMTDLFAPQTSIVFEVVRVNLFTYIESKI